jgi:hypothetical protein
LNDLVELDLALELTAQLRCGATRSADPLADLGSDLRQTLGPENEQPDHENEDELRETNVEHGIAVR